MTTGVGDPVALLAASQGFLRTSEILDLLRALRARNAEHPGEPVRIVHGPASSATSLETVEREMAERTLAWHRDTGHRIVHWAGIAHVVAGERRGLTPSGGTHRSSGGHLRAELGDGYVAVAATVGEVEDGSVPPTPRQFTEAPLSAIDAGWIPVRGVKGPQAGPGLARWSPADPTRRPALRPCCRCGALRDRPVGAARPSTGSCTSGAASQCAHFGALLEAAPEPVQTQWALLG